MYTRYFMLFWIFSSWNECYVHNTYILVPLHFRIAVDPLTPFAAAKSTIVMGPLIPTKHCHGPLPCYDPLLVDKIVGDWIYEVLQGVLASFVQGVPFLQEVGLCPEVEQRSRVLLQRVQEDCQELVDILLRVFDKNFHFVFFAKSLRNFREIFLSWKFWILVKIFIYFSRKKACRISQFQGNFGVKYYMRNDKFRAKMDTFRETKS